MSQENKSLSAEALEALSAEELLNINIEEIADVEPYTVRPEALYSFDVKDVAVQKVGEKTGIQVTYLLKEMIESSEELTEDEMPELPGELKETYFLEGGKGFGIRMFMTIFRVPAVENGWTQVAEVVENIRGLSGSGLLTINRYKDANGNDKESNRWDAQTISFE